MSALDWARCVCKSLLWLYALAIVGVALLAEPSFTDIVYMTLRALVLALVLAVLSELTERRQSHDTGA